MSIFGTRAWARVRRAVLARDRHTCQMAPDGNVCGQPATTVDHIVRREHGGGDELANLRAACAACNYGDRPPATTTPTVRLTLKAALVVSTLDAAGAPTTVGRRRATPILADRHPGVRFRMADIDTACRYRRHRGSLVRL